MKQWDRLRFMAATLAPGRRPDFSISARSRVQTRRARRHAGDVSRPGAVLARRHADELAEARAERAQALAPDGEADLGDRQLARAQQRLRALDAAGHEKGVGRLPLSLAGLAGGRRG